MAHYLTVKGQVTIPKRIRDSLGLKPGDGVDFMLGENGDVVVRRAEPAPEGGRIPDAFERARGAADYKWPSTAEFMKFVRGKDYEIDGD